VHSVSVAVGESQNGDKHRGPNGKARRALP
jgi:hypothetical protein